MNLYISNQVHEYISYIWNYIEQFNHKQILSLFTKLWFVPGHANNDDDEEGGLNSTFVVVVADADVDDADDDDWLSLSSCNQLVPQKV